LVTPKLSSVLGNKVAPKKISAQMQDAGVSMMEKNDHLNALQTAFSIQPPETTAMPSDTEMRPPGQITAQDAGDDASSNSSDSKEVLDHMVRIDVDLDPRTNDPTAHIVSYFGSYCDYLEENDYIDPEQAKQKEALKK